MMRATATDVQRSDRRRQFLLAVTAVASGVTITCSCGGGIGLYNPGWDAAFEDAAKKDAASSPFDAAVDGPSDASEDVGDDTVETNDATGD